MCETKEEHWGLIGELRTDLVARQIARADLRGDPDGQSLLAHERARDAGEADEAQ